MNNQQIKYPHLWIAMYGEETPQFQAKPTVEIAKKRRCPIGVDEERRKAKKMREDEKDEGLM